MHCTNANSTESFEKQIFNITKASSVTINNIDSQNITYDNSINLVNLQDICDFFTSDILRNIRQQQFNSNMRKDKLDDSFCSTEIDK